MLGPRLSPQSLVSRCQLHTNRTGSCTATALWREQYFALRGEVRARAEPAHSPPHKIHTRTRNPMRVSRLDNLEPTRIDLMVL
jgi:hypothetical protein